VNAEKTSVCPLDCPDTCSLSVTVAGDQLVAVRGSKVNPITHGAVCAKVANYYPEFVHGPNRLRHPLKRVGAKGAGKFERISWDEAFTRVARLMKADRDKNFIAQNAAGATVNRWVTTGFLAASASSNESGYITHKAVRSTGILAFDNQARV